MIAHLIGAPTVLEDQLIINVNGVGYGVAASSKVLQYATGKEQIELYIYTHVREDQIRLYGFLTHQEQQLFEMVTDVSGIGPATALHLMDRDPDQLIAAVQEADVSFFKPIPRIGKKTAQKIIIELRGKLGELKELNLAPLSAKQQTVVSALENLGFDEEDVRTVIDGIEIDKLDEGEAIKAVIKRLGS